MTHSMITDDDFSSPAVVRALEAALRAELSAVRSSEEDLRRICQDLNIENAVLRTRHLQGKLSKPPADVPPNEAWLARMLNESDKKLTQVTVERDMLKYARKRDTILEGDLHIAQQDVAELTVERDALRTETERTAPVAPTFAEELQAVSFAAHRQSVRDGTPATVEALVAQLVALGAEKATTSERGVRILILPSGESAL